MHEYSLFLSLLKIIEDQLKPFKNPRVSKAVLLIGEFSGIDLEYLKEVIKNFKRGTPLDRAEIIFEEEPLKVRCFSCGREGEPQENKALCSFCGSFEVKIIGGLDLILKTLEIEDEEGFSN
jgi:hydrogenase nickel incorporation protein HypA/HybF